MVDAPRLVNSDGSPTRPECAVTPALDASGSGRCCEPQSNHLRRQRHQRGSPVPDSWRRAASGGRAPRRPFTNRTSFTSPSWLVLLRRTSASSRAVEPP